MTEREALQELVAAIKDSPLVSHFDGEQRLSDAYNAGVAIIAAPPAPEPTAEPADEGLLLLVEDTANMLRGMLMDPAIPLHAKSAMLNRINDLEQAVEDRLP